MHMEFGFYMSSLGILFPCVTIQFYIGVSSGVSGVAFSRAMDDCFGGSC